MSDDEFDAADAGSDLSKPVSVGSLYKGSYVLIKGFPVRLTDYSTAKTGKHGSAKAMYVGNDIFTGRKYEDSKPTSATAQEPIGEFASGSPLPHSPARVALCFTAFPFLSVLPPPPPHACSEPYQLPACGHQRW